MCLMNNNNWPKGANWKFLFFCVTSIGHWHLASKISKIKLGYPNQNSLAQSRLMKGAHIEDFWIQPCDHIGHEEKSWI